MKKINKNKIIEISCLVVQPHGKDKTPHGWISLNNIQICMYLLQFEYHWKLNKCKVLTEAPSVCSFVLSGQQSSCSSVN